jgi:signal transduction histidine kinase
MSRRHLPSIAVPITFGAVTVPITVALLAGWTVLLGRRIAVSPAAGDLWLLGLGALAFAAIITILVLFSVFLAREIREVRTQDSFIDSVTHELKSPLASLSLGLDTLGRHDLDASQRERVRTMMRADVDRLSCFIDDVLQASRLAHAPAPVDLAEVDVGELVARCAAAVSARHDVPDGAIALAVEPGLTVATDRAALEIVVKNLLDNAVKYSDGDVAVRVSARRNESGELALEVTDRGVGIDAADLRKVFRRFYRSDREAVRSRHGTGIGLFVVSCLVRNLDGRVTAHSEGRGLGATLRVTLPLGAA